MQTFPSRSELTIGFAHVAYQMSARFERREAGIRHLEVRDAAELRRRMPELDVLVVSGLWDNGLLEISDRLRFIQSIGAGYDQFPLEELKRRNIRLASARGVNRNAVSEHAFALILALTRHLHHGRDNQHRRHWRGMIPDIERREEELAGKTLGIIGIGEIGARVAVIAKAFDMRVIATKRNPDTYRGPADEVLPSNRLDDLLRQSDVVVLTCPLTDETRGLIDQRALRLMQPTAYLINVARGACVEEPALLEALKSGRIAGAGLDHFVEDPLPADSEFWALDNVVITPHTGGETRLYEDNVIDILLENIGRLERGETELRNQVV